MEHFCYNFFEILAQCCLTLKWLIELGSLLIVISYAREKFSPLISDFSESDKS